jgi:hypothetical protein
MSHCQFVYQNNDATLSIHVPSMNDRNGNTNMNDVTRAS